jgi:hypothetical protein
MPCQYHPHWLDHSICACREAQVFTFYTVILLKKYLRGFRPQANYPTERAPLVSEVSANFRG